jgi:hypothetical protein
MSSDPRLADPVLLALAAMRARQHQATAPRQRVTLRVVYSDALGQEPDVLYTGPTYARVAGDNTWQLIRA